MTGYLRSALDKKLVGRFQNDMSRQHLRSVVVYKGAVRSLCAGFKANYDFPITAICGANGAGKSTLLALTACAFHNEVDGYNPQQRKYPWYTFSDFLLQSTAEKRIEGVEIGYEIAHDNWRTSIRMRSKAAVGLQIRKKNVGGRWNDYSKRVDRNVLFLGVDRVVPEYEKSVYRSYRSRLRPGMAGGYEEDVAKAVSAVLGDQYDDLAYHRHRSYKLPIVSRGGVRYSGFNMGAGESALFELFTAIYACPKSLLLVVDELELGLHPEAQRRLVQQLKEITRDRPLQIVCTTHSAHVLESLPPEARIFLRRVGQQTEAIPKISPVLAAGLLSGNPTGELDILVEDEVGAAIIRLALTTSHRRRVNIIPVGSHAAVVRHLAMRFIEARTAPTIVFLDGDQRGERSTHETLFSKALETKERIEEYGKEFATRVHYLPGSTWPEDWFVERMTDAAFSRFDELFGLAESVRFEVRQAAKNAGKHNEVFTVASWLQIDQRAALDALAACALRAEVDELTRIRDVVAGFLD